MQSYHHNSVCDFSGDIVSYLYEETNFAEKTAFETHLAKCGACANELAAFSEVRFALGDWRETEFAPISTPEIVIPYHESAVMRGLAAEKRVSLFDGLRRFFAFSHARQIVGAAFAVIIFCAFAVLIGFKFTRQTDVAAVQTDNSTQKQIQPINEMPVPVAESVNNGQNIDNTQVADIFSNAAPKNNINNKTILISQKQPAARQQNPTVKVVQIPVRTDRRSNLKQPSPETMAKNYQTNAKPSHLNGDDDEIKDDSLRLSELFDEDDKQD